MTKQKIITTTPNQQILWSMVYLNTIPIRNLSHKTEKNVWGAIVRGLLFGGQLSGGANVLLPTSETTCQNRDLLSHQRLVVTTDLLSHHRLIVKTETCCHIRDLLSHQTFCYIRLIVTSETCFHNRFIVRSKTYSHIRDYLSQQRLLVTSETFCHNRNLLSHQTLKSLVVTTKVLRCW